MKNRLLFLVTLFSLFFPYKSMAGWERLFNTGMSISSRFLSFENVIIVSSDSGIYRSTDSGISWMFYIIDRIKIPDHEDILITPGMFSKNDKFLFASTNAGVYVSQDTGRTWKALGPSPEGKALSMMSIFAKGSYVFTTMAGGGVFRSTDNGLTWVYLGPHRFYNYMDYRDKFFAAAMDGLWYSIDLGQTWNLCHDFDVYPMYISAFSLASTDKYMFTDCWDKIYRSSDAGMTFQIKNTGLPFTNYNILGMYSVHNLLFAGLTNNRIYLSEDQGEYWRDISIGLDTLGIVNWYGMSGEKLLISKNGCLWSLDLSLLNPVPVRESINPATYELSQNYPNPFNPKTTIEYSLPKHSHVKIMIVDMLGRELRTLVDEDKTNGAYKLEFDAKDLPSGVYFYHLQTNEFSQTKKLVLMK
jgi:hypothetical protein